jgi:hypothetical protein
MTFGKMMHVPALLVCLAFCGCVTQKPLVDGSSFDRAFLVHSIEEEAAILRDQFPGARPAQVEEVGDESIVFMHRTEVHQRRMYSIHTLVLTDRTIRDVYFDVTPRTSLMAPRPNQ